MKFICLELKGYQRLMLRHIKHIKIEPKQMIQLILGTNGSGKSSLVYEMSPLAASDKDYETGGFKIATIHHNNSVYVLKSLFPASGKKFYFEKDDEELNPTGSITLYTELVRKEFRYTKEIHELMIGTVRFHNMEVATRRWWFTRLSEQDYTYALGYFKRLQEKYRDAVGAHRVLNERLVQVTSKLLPVEDEKKYRKDIDDLQRIINIILDAKAGKHIDRRETEISLSEANHRLTAVATALQEGVRKISPMAFSSQRDMMEQIAKLTMEISINEKKYREQIEFVDKEIETANALKKADVDSFESLDKHIADFKAQIVEKEKTKQLNLEFDDTWRAFEALDSITGNLSDIFSEIEENADRRRSVSRYQELVQFEKAHVETLAKYNRDLDSLLKQKEDQEHFRDHNKLECPKCGHGWSKGFELAKYERLSGQIKAQLNTIETIEGILVKTREELQANKTYLELFRSFTLITRSLDVLKPLWDHLIDSKVILVEPRTVMYVISMLKTDLVIDLEIKDLLEKIREHEKIRELTSRTQELNLAKIEAHIAELSLSLGQLKGDIELKKKQLESAEYTYKIHLENSSLIDEMFDIDDRMLNFTNDLVMLRQREVLNSFVQHFRLILSEKEHAIAQQSTQKALIENIQGQIRELEDKQVVLSKAIKKLSPSEGLIARGMTGSINHFVRQTNSFIKKIWLYPLELLPIQMSDDVGVDLDYKFELSVNDNPRPIPDIKQGSTAIKEIIDLAFKQVAIKYLHLENIPLYLDEFAASFDKAHRQAAIGVVNQLVATGNFSQVFMISHYEESFGSFHNTDMTVLCNENLGLSMQPNMNSVTTISYV